VGAVIGRAFTHKSGTFRGYIGMLAVDKEYRRKYKIGTELVRLQIEAMKRIGVTEVPRC
jgi:ribosomal protein S18 acetylase RimI-like enzyme